MCTDHTVYGVCTASELLEPRDSLTYTFRAVDQEERVGLCPSVCVVWPGQLTKGKQLRWVSCLGDGRSFVSLGLLVALCVQVWTEPSAWRLRREFTPNPHPTLHQQTLNKYRDSRGEINKYNNNYKGAHTKIQLQQKTNTTPSNTNIQQQLLRFTKNTRHPKPRREFGSNHEGFFFCVRACLCKYSKVGITRQDDVPTARSWPIFVPCQREDSRRRMMCAQ